MRTGMMIVAAMSVAGLVSAADAAPRQSGRAGWSHSAIQRAAPMQRPTAAHRENRHLSGLGRIDRRRGGSFIGGYGAGWPYLAEDRIVVESTPRLIRPADADPLSFANLPARTGIPYPPKPEPVIYRLDGRRDRPLARIIRLNDPEPRGERRSRFAQAETGALLLRVPGR